MRNSNFTIFFLTLLMNNFFPVGGAFTVKLRLSSLPRTYLLKVPFPNDSPSRMRLADLEPLARERLLTLTGRSVKLINNNKLSEYVSDGDEINFEADLFDNGSSEILRRFDAMEQRSQKLQNNYEVQKDKIESLNSKISDQDNKIELLKADNVGLLDEIVGLKEDNVGMLDEIVGLKADNVGLKSVTVGLVASIDKDKHRQQIKHLHFCIQDLNSIYMFEKKFEKQSNLFFENRIQRNAEAHLLSIGKQVPRPLNLDKYLPANIKDESRPMLIHKLFIISNVFTRADLTSFESNDEDKELFILMRKHFSDLRMSVSTKVWEERFDISSKERAKLKEFVDEYFGYISGNVCDLT